MTKPYDVLMDKPSLHPGHFACVENRLLVHLLSVSESECEVAIGACAANQFGVQADTAQVLSDFFGALAKQLKPRIA